MPTLEWRLSVSPAREFKSSTLGLGVSSRPALTGRAFVSQLWRSGEFDIDDSKFGKLASIERVPETLSVGGIHFEANKDFTLRWRHDSVTLLNTMRLR
jgi:hypothetical protein